MRNSSIASIHLDQFLTEWFFHYWRSYPEIPLQEEILYNLLLYDSISLGPDFSRNLISECKWGREFERFSNIRDIVVVRDRVEMSAYRWLKALERLSDLNNLDFQDIQNLIYCFRHKLPFSVSHYRSPYLHNLGVLISETLALPSELSIQTGHHIAKWIIELEIPHLFVRTKRLTNHSVASNPLFQFIVWNPIKSGIFISPNELFDLLEMKNQVRAFRSTVAEFSKNAYEQLEMKDKLREIRDAVSFQSKISGFVFKIVGVVLSPVPFAAPLLAALECGIDWYILRSENWLIHFNQINRKIRKDHLLH
jgi:hypothetical protein